MEIKQIITMAFIAIAGICLAIGGFIFFKFIASFFGVELFGFI